MISYDKNYVPTPFMRVVAFVGAALFVFGTSGLLYGGLKPSDSVMIVLGCALLLYRFLKVSWAGEKNDSP